MSNEIAETEYKLKINYVIYTTVIDVYVVSDQWMIHFDGSRESLAFGHKDLPSPFEKGNRVKITFERLDDNKRV